jgi:ABC-type Mn2+/Zn2+ transport system permease subunit
MENLAAIIFAVGVGTALLFLPIDKAEQALVGSINSISANETLVVIVLSLITAYIIKSIYQKIMLINVNEDLAKIEGINISIYNLLYLLSIAIIIALGVYLVGGLITAALVAIPAATSKNISSSLFSYKLTATILGSISSMLGIFLAYYAGLPIGPMVIVVSAVFFALSIIAMRKE